MGQEGRWSLVECRSPHEVRAHSCIALTSCGPLHLYFKISCGYKNGVSNVRRLNQPVRLNRSRWAGNTS